MLNIKKILSLLAFGLLIADAASARQGSADTITVYYHRGRSDVDLSLRDNKALDDFLQRFNAVMQDSTCRLVSFRIDAYASPDGTAVANGRLTEKRAKRLSEYLRKHTGLSDSLLTVQGHGVDWKGLEAIVITEEIPCKKEVLDVLQNTPEWIFDKNGRVIDGRKRRLGMLGGGVPYNFLLENISPSLRRTRITVSYTTRPAWVPVLPVGDRIPKQTGIENTASIMPPSVPPAASSAVQQAKKKEFRPLIAIKTNILHWASVMPDFKSYTFVPNLEIEWFFKDRWSLSGTGNYAKWDYSGNNFLGISSWSLEPRWWLKNDGSFRWLYLGVYGQTGDYDVQNDRVRLDGNTGKLWGAGLSAGAAIPFTSRLGLEIGLRAGYRHAKVKGYVYEVPDYFREFTENDNHWGVTGIKASIYWRFGKKTIK